MGAPRQPLNPTTHSVGHTAKLVTVQSVTSDGKTAICVDRQNTEVRVPMLLQRSKGPLPEVGETWVITQDLGTWTFAALSAADASSFGSGDGFITAAAQAPASPAKGQLWMNGANANEFFQWNGSTWVKMPLGAQAIAPGSLTSAQLSPNAGITAQQVAFLPGEIGATKVTRGPAPPPHPAVGDLWYNSLQDNKLSIWDGTTWEQVLLGAGAVKPGSLTGAQLSAAAGIGPSQVSFSFRDIGGMSVSLQAAAPAHPLLGDLWYDQTNGYALRQWNGNAWVPYQFGTEAIAARSITAELVAAGTITAQHLAAGIVYAGIVDATTINAATFTGSLFQGLNFRLSINGLCFYAGTPGIGNLVAGLGPTNVNGQVVDDFGNVLPGMLTAGPNGSGQIALEPNAQQQFNITGAIAGTLMGISQFFSGDANQVVPGILGSLLLGSGATAKEALVATSPFASGNGAAMILESQNDGGTDTALITFGTVASPDGSTIVFTPVMTIYPTAVVVYNGGGSQTVVTKTSGSGTIPIPVGVTTARAQAWGAAGGSSASVASNNWSAGGGGGEYAEEPNLAVTGGGTVAYSVGAGGPGGTAGASGTNGANSTLTGTSVTVTGHAGGGGTIGTSGASPRGGTAGSGSTNTIHHPGGTGASFNTFNPGLTTGGGGGGSGGLTAAGNNAINGSGGSAVAGGGYGGSSSINGAGQHGGAPGGGGASPGSMPATGYAGGNGQVRLTYSGAAAVVGFSVNLGAAFNDQFNNTIPAGTFLTMPSGLSGQLPVSQTDTTPATVTQATLTALSKVWAVPANDAKVNTCYRITVAGSGTWGATQQVLTLSLNAFGIGGVAVIPVGATQFPASTAFTWRAQAEVVITVTGATASHVSGMSLTLAQSANNELTIGGTINSAGGFSGYTTQSGTANTSVNSNVTLQAKWAATGGAPTITSDYSIFERLGP